MEEFVADTLETADIDTIIDRLMTDYGQEIMQLEFSYVKSNEIAEDLTQEIFVKCYKSLHKFNGRSKIKTWLWRIAINHCKDYLKSWHHRKVLLIYEKTAEPASSNENVEEQVIQSEEEEQLKQAVLQLPIKYREPVYLYYFQEMSIKEIELMTGVKQNTVKTRMRRAMTLLRQRLEG